MYDNSTFQHYALTPDALTCALLTRRGENRKEGTAVHTAAYTVGGQARKHTLEKPRHCSLGPRQNSTCLHLHLSDMLMPEFRHGWQNDDSFRAPLTNHSRCRYQQIQRPIGVPILSTSRCTDACLVFRLTSWVPRREPKQPMLDLFTLATPNRFLKAIPNQYPNCPNRRDDFSSQGPSQTAKKPASQTAS